jgi:HSP20 family protein
MKKKPERPRTVTVAMVKSAHATGLERLEVERLRDRVGRLFAALQEVAEMDVTPAPGTFAPPLDVCETEDALVVFVELAGVSSDKINVHLTSSQLRIEGEKKHASHKRALTHHCSERSYGRFQRAVTIRIPINIAETTAELRNGLLTVRLPKLKNRRATAFKVPIESKDEE